MAQHNDTGNKAEEMAATFLLKKGYSILDRNYVFGKGEIDIIALKDNWLVFIEVRARSEVVYGFPEQTISKAKASLIMKTAENYIYQKDWRGKIRFDIIAIVVGQNFEIRQFEDVFF
ncbi:YraN family protein [Emticicia sp. BO119]|uniref:YraN family protein n=1 Tax=Emticicia sp. BO119 TaxID=2757768 RepID=UPI0015F00447|nr:YraN family protein [Emticicia sp. BO119]MBA4851618.1 YraN family protein [Emticicia sp. BO119]